VAGTAETPQRTERRHPDKAVQDENRFGSFSARDEGMSVLLDYSKNLVTGKTIKLLLELANPQS